MPLAPLKNEGYTGKLRREINKWLKHEGVEWEAEKLEREVYERVKRGKNLKSVGIYCWGFVAVMFEEKRQRDATIKEKWVHVTALAKWSGEY